MTLFAVNGKIIVYKMVNYISFEILLGGYGYEEEMDANRCPGADPLHDAANGAICGFRGR